MTSEFDPTEPAPDGDSQGGREIVDLIFSTLREFRQEMAPRLALDGMFVSTDEPLVRGTKVRFRFVLPEEFVLAQGDAIVAWRRTRSSHPDLEPGMALWFEEVEQRSRDIISELVDIQATSGDAVFDTRRKAAEVGEFVANEFAGAFATSFDLPALKEPDASTETEEPGAAKRTEIAAPREFEREEMEKSREEEGPLPGWLSGEERTSSAGGESGEDASLDTTSDFAAPEPESGGHEEFEVSLMTDDSEPDVTPLSEAPGSLTDLTVTLGDNEGSPRRRRRWPLGGAAVVLLAAVAAVVWWTVIRPQGFPILEDQLSVEAEAPETGVVLLEDDAEIEPAAESPDVVEEIGPPAGDASEAVREDAQPPARIVADKPATRVIDVGAERLGDGTAVNIRGDGDFDDTRLQVSMLTGPPRVLVRVSQIETYYRPNEVVVGSPEVLQVRIGYHPEDTPPKLYVVIDLADESMVIRETSVAGDTIRVAVGPE